MNNQKIIFHMETVLIDVHGSLSRCKAAEIPPDTDGRQSERL